MAKIKVQAQHLQPGDVVGSGEEVTATVLNSTRFPSSKVQVNLKKLEGMRSGNERTAYWGKHTIIVVDRKEKS